MKKVVTLSLFFTLLVCNIEAQSQNSKLLETPLSFQPYTDYWKFMRSQHFRFWGGVSLNVTKFPNAYLLGYKPQIKVTHFPFILEVGNINDIWTLSSTTYPPNSNKHPVQRGGNMSSYDFALSLCPLPHFSRLSEIVVPYVGFGYQFSSVKLLKDGPLNQPSILNLSGWMYKVGINLFFDKCWFNIIIDYERSFQNPNRLRGYQSLSVGILVDTKRKVGQKDKLYLLY